MRGIAVADVGYTHTKLILFNEKLEILAERKISSSHPEGPPYKSNDPAPALAFFAKAIPELDAILPIDVIIPCGHGAAVVALDEKGELVLPAMDYNAEPPSDVIAAYQKIMPDFAESASPFLPMALMHGMQLFWMQQKWPDAFAKTKHILPWIQYMGYRLSGSLACEITSMCCQSHLMNVPESKLSSLVVNQGWAPFFAPIRPAWEEIGRLRPEFCGQGLKGEARVLTGVHDSSANFLRYLAGGKAHFTLVSTGTWSIAFDTDTKLEALIENLDTSANRDVLGRVVACSRFFGGREFDLLAGDSAKLEPSLDVAKSLIANGIMALPSFSSSPGPKPGTADQGKIIGAIKTPLERVTLASIYCAQMVSSQLDALYSSHDIILDGPFTQNPVLLSILASLRPKQKLWSSNLSNGTAAGAACLALMADGKLPQVDINMKLIEPEEIPSLAQYQAEWEKNSKPH